MHLRKIGIAAVRCFATFVLAGTAYGQQPNYQVMDTGPATPLGCGSGANQLINQSGQAVETLQTSGTSANGPTTSATTYFVSNGTLTDIGSLFGYATFGRGINSQGTVIGASATTAQGGAYHAFVWASTEGMRDLAPSSTADACGINSNGDVVGAMATSSGPHAFVYIGGHTFDLNNVGMFPSEGGFSGFQHALSITDVGQIFGVGLVNGSQHGFIMTPTNLNLLVEGGFEGYPPRRLGPPGWVSDNGRAIAAKSETNQPNSGSQNGACWATTHEDCGMYQELRAPATGIYELSFYANADRSGGLVGANVNGTNVASANVSVNGFRNYGLPLNMTFTASQGDTIHVWMYSPATPGYVVIDDVILTFSKQRFY